MKAVGIVSSFAALLLVGCTSSNSGWAVDKQTGLKIVTIGELRDRAAANSVSYRIWGEPALRPSRVFDDGQKTTLEWPARADLPAVFAVDANGHEFLPTAMMRDDRLVIDAVYPLLVFKIDKKQAFAKRVPPRDGH